MQTETQKAAGLTSVLSVELGTLTVGNFAEITINGDIAAEVYFEKDGTKQSFVNEVNAVYDFIASDNPEDEVEVFLVKRTLIKTGHEFVLDETVCHDFGEPKGQCAVCGGYCKMTKQRMIEKHGTPSQFKIALGDAIAQGFVTFDEAVAAISKYELEFDNAE